MTQAYSPFPTVDNGRPARRVLAILARLLLILALLVPWASSGAARLRQRPPGLMVTPIPAALTPGNENWASGFIAAGLNGEVNAVAVGPEGSLYVGGFFTTAGDGAANSIARWDGSA